MFTVSSNILIKYNGNDKKVIIPDGIESIGDSAFEWCEDIEEAVLPYGITAIGDDSFYGCKKLKKINLPDTLKSIGNRAFSGCSELCEIIFPKQTESIGEYAFEWCGLKKVTLPETIRHLADGTFRKCRKLTDIHVPSGCKVFGDNTFASCTSVKQLTLPDTLTRIGNGCFRNCTALEKIHLPEKLTQMGNGVFAECISLTEISIPGAVTVIPDEAFGACVSLVGITLSEKTETIGKRAFRRCHELRNIVFPLSLKNIGDGAFSGCSKINPAFSSAPETVGRTVFPNIGVDTPDGIKIMFVSSFLRSDNVRSVPEIIIPASVTKLHCGYEKLLTSEDMLCGKTCLAHVLMLKKYNCRIFSGSRYYPDGAVFEDEFDFSGYDGMFSRSLNEERHLIAAYRLAYPLSLTDNHKRTYENAIEHNHEEIALFAVRMSDTVLLEYIMKKADFSPYFYDIIYEEAKKTRRYELLSVINMSASSTTDSLFDFLDDNSDSDNDNFRYTLTPDGYAVITHCRTDSRRLMIPNNIDGNKVTVSEDFICENAERIILSDSVFYPGRISGCVADFTYCKAKIYVPDNNCFCRSFIYNGNKYFDFDYFDRTLCSYKGKDSFKAMLYRTFYPVNISEETLSFYLTELRKEQNRLSSLFSENEIKMLNTVLTKNEPCCYTAEYEKCFIVPSCGEEKTDEAVFYFSSEGTLTKCSQTCNADTLTIPSFIRHIGENALEGIKTEKLVLPAGLLSINPNAFTDAEFTHAVINENTALSHMFFTKNKKIRFVTITDSDGHDDTLYYPDIPDDRERERLAFIFVYRIPGKSTGRFSYRDYDSMQLTDGENIRRAYYRISSVNRPETYDYMDVADKVLQQMHQNNDALRLRIAKNNGYKVI